MSTYEEKFTSSWPNQKPQIVETSDERATELGPDAGQ
ncbi:uncharacterized protein FTOL_11347 [Fusarium torulosum]|uniref:Uncharacterized protein n=1 Tax=Fusarium torulosum TaxID=33205 RepID=A0AAE8MIQ0_9HYPO|nr:uncharacterized protein FTOL_11347 [Fusarium torulosum]